MDHAVDAVRLFGVADRLRRDSELAVLPVHSSISLIVSRFTNRDRAHFSIRERRFSLLGRDQIEYCLSGSLFRYQNS